MRYYSTKNKSQHYSFRDVVLKGLPDDNGLFMPEKIEKLPLSFFESNLSLPEIGFISSMQFVKDEIGDVDLERICQEAFNFPVPLIELNNDTFIAELFHGPTLAFKDFGARYMARVMSLLNKNENKKLTILVATSGDTGSAVADGFFDVEGIEVFILYPSGGVSELQEKQLTTYGKNISAIEIKGTFDDCQRLVKTAFLDKDFNNKYRLSSANSINIARLIPQMVYYFSSAKSIKNNKVVFTVPSGNFGNLTAGLFAKSMGLNISHFIAATNANDTVPEYLSGKEFVPVKSVPTISNAMDVGNPSNFGRMLDLFSSRENMQKVISGYSISDTETEDSMRRIYKEKNYISDPHCAVAITAWENQRHLFPGASGIILGTAHPAKFIDTVERVLSMQVELPEALEKVSAKTKKAHLLSSSFEDFKNHMV